jgi:hypothetical protein
MYVVSLSVTFFFKAKKVKQKVKQEGKRKMAVSVSDVSVFLPQKVKPL